MIAQQLKNFIKQGGESFIIGDEDKARLDIIQKGHRDSLSNLKDLKKKEMEEIRKSGVN